jgi:hypothetical protein
MQIVCHTGGLTVTGLKLLNQQLLPQSWCPCSDACGRRPQWDLVMKSRRIFGKLKTCFEDFRSTWMQHEIYWRSTGDLLEIYWRSTGDLIRCSFWAFSGQIPQKPAVPHNFSRRQAEAAQVALLQARNLSNCAALCSFCGSGWCPPVMFVGL